MEADYRTVMDLLYFLLTLMVVWLMRCRLKSTYMKELDTMWISLLVVPSEILAVLVNPRTPHVWLVRVVFAFTIYVEPVSVLPQIRYMQNAKMVEPFTGYYFFALDISIFFALAY
ncbi:unnamed protein product [Lathyrus sativus]|nr:unnamed protein product [Lathyrus sativus]